MSVLKFKCTLLSDVILNQKAATEGPNETLDFIPGSCFLGIVASEYDKFNNEDKAIEIFHSGKVRFGDAHPSTGNFRGLKVPASMFHPKLKEVSEELYIHHKIPNLNDNELKQKQLKQCRSGFYNFSSIEATQIETKVNFAIKSAYDKETRHSKDEQMYGYQSLQKGLTLYFEVEITNESLVKEIKDALIGKKKNRIGRSRTAQYGLVEITETEFDEVKSQQSNGQYVEVYADGRLIFLNDEGLPTFQPKVEQLGLQGEICWEKSQIRTFQYAPWNFKRQCFDTDRCGIEKGSVIVVRTDTCPEQSQYVGSYKNEGFGKVIYNPSFLTADENGKAKVTLSDKADKTSLPDNPSQLADTPLLCFLNQKKKQEELEAEVYEKVNKWVCDNEKLFKGKTFASQWGNIRSIAMKNKSKQALLNELFDKEREKYGKAVPDGCLTHGVAAEKWAEQGRKVRFESFVRELTDENAQLAIINLASEMAKKCKENK